MVRLFKKLIFTFFYELDRWLKGFFAPEDTLIQTENRLRIMYARGEVSPERFSQLRYRLKNGSLLPSELPLIHQEALHLGRGQAGPERCTELTRRMDSLYLDLALVRETRQELDQRQADLAAESAWFKQQADEAHHNAELMLSDEAASRSALDLWQQLLSLSGNLDQRLATLKMERQNLQALEAELRSTIAQLRALDTLEQQAALSLRMRQDLLIQGPRR